MPTEILSLSQEIERDLNNWQPPLSTKEKDQRRRFLQKFIEQKKSLPEALDFTENDMECLYRYGYDFYKKGKYKEACGFFSIINLVDENNQKYAMGFASALQMLKEYEKAIDVYKVASMLNITDPRPCYYLAECYLNTEQKFDAFASLALAILLAGENPKYSQLKELATLAIQKIADEITSEEL